MAFDVPTRSRQLLGRIRAVGNELGMSEVVLRAIHWAGYVPSVPWASPRLGLSRSLVRATLRARRHAAGFPIEGRVRVEGLDIPYLEGGRGEPVVLLHGYGDNKDSFVETARALVRRHRVVLPDLPGFGAASKPMTLSYSVCNLARVFTAFLDRLEIETLHVGGNSLGGSIAAKLAIEHGARVRSLALLAPHGVRMPVPSVLEERLREGENLLSVHDVSAFPKLMALVLERRLPVPKILLDHRAREAVEHAYVWDKVVADLVDEDLDLTAELARIRARTLLVWGDCDRLVHPSAAWVWLAGIPHAELVFLHGTGHMPQYEDPNRVLRLFERVFERS